MKEITAYYDKDTFRTHRYNIAEGQEVSGSIYVPKDLEEKPRELHIKLKIKETRA